MPSTLGRVSDDHRVGKTVIQWIALPPLAGLQGGVLLSTTECLTLNPADVLASLPSAP